MLFAKKQELTFLEIETKFQELTKKRISIRKLKERYGIYRFQFWIFNLSLLILYVATLNNLNGDTNKTGTEITVSEPKIEQNLISDTQNDCMLFLHILFKIYY